MSTFNSEITPITPVTAPFDPTLYQIFVKCYPYGGHTTATQAMLPELVRKLKKNQLKSQAAAAELQAILNRYE